jgi:hypothetical protein
MSNFDKINPGVDKKCAPHRKGDPDTCYDLETLQKMVDSYNKNFDNPKNKGKYPNGRIDYTTEQYNNKKYLLKELTKKLENACDNQICWLKLDVIDNLNSKKSVDELEYEYFRPEGPAKKVEQFKWLSNRDIDNVLHQYEKAYPDFEYLETVPIDFAELSNEVSKLNFNKLKKNNKCKIGVVFNLDKHYQGGSHWVALYSDLNKKQIYFFDSYGMKPNKEIKELMAKIANYLSGGNSYTASNILKEQNKYIGGSTIDIRYNTMEHQKGGSECGVYSISFILRLLNGEPFDNIIGKRVPDEKVNKCRRYYFTHYGG